MKRAVSTSRTCSNRGYLAFGWRIWALAATMLLSPALLADKGTVTNSVVPVLIESKWNQQISPYNDYSPYSMAGGCVAVAVSQELLYWQWPWRLEGVRETSHIVVDHDRHNVRFDGNEPFRWDTMALQYNGTQSLASRHEAARLMLACQSLVQMQFLSVGSAASKSVGGALEWYEYAGAVNPAKNGGDDEAIAKIRADMEWGSPVQVGINVAGYGGHEVVGLGFAEGTNNTTGAATSLMGLNYGWGAGVGDGWWYDLKDNTHFKSVHIGFRPLKTVQIEPINPLSDDTVAIKWHLPNCYTNKIDGFEVSKAKLSSAPTTFEDDFSSYKGRSSNTNELRIVDGAIRAWDATATAIYTYDDKFALTENSVLKYDVGSAYMASMSVHFEIKCDNGCWENVHEVALSGGASAYYNYGTMTKDVMVPLGAYAGSCVQLRLVVEYLTGGVFPYADAHVKIDNLSVSNIRAFVQDGETEVVSDIASRAKTFSGLSDGETYAFTVRPVMSNGDASVPQSVTTTIGDPVPVPESVEVSSLVDCIEMVQEGFYLGCDGGTTEFAVSVPNATCLEALPSHLSFLPDSAVTTTKTGDGEWTVAIDGSQPVSMHEGTKMILTLRASNDDGATVFKDMELCFNSQRTLGGRTYTLVQTGIADKPLNFVGESTIDGDGHALTIEAGAFAGDGEVALTDGTFVFEGLEGFGGTLVVDASAAASLSGTSFGTLRGSGDIAVTSDATIEDYSGWDGTVSVASGATLTVSSAGLGWTEVASGGTLKVVLTDEQIAYGHSLGGKVAHSGTLLLVDGNGNVKATNTDTIADTANTWTGVDAWVGENYTAKWSRGLPSDGDYVKFYVNDSDFGATMMLNLSADTELGCVYATGLNPLVVSKANNVASGTLTAQMLKNDVEVTIETDCFVVNAIDPGANVILPKSKSLACEIASDKSGYLKTYYGGSTLQSILGHDEMWQGTVVFTGSQSGTALNNYGNSSSYVRFSAASGYLGSMANNTFSPALELVDDGETPALDWNNGWGGYTQAFCRVTGTGTFKTSTPKKGGGERGLIKDVSGFAGSFDLSSKTIAIGSAMPTEYLSNNGRLHICSGYGATIASGKTWRIADGVYLDGNGSFDVRGTLVASNIFATVANSPLTLSDGGTIEVNAVSSDSQRINANLYAGTFRIAADATVQDGFCFSSTNDTYTTLDVRGNNLTFASGAISGHGIVYPTSSDEQKRGSVTFTDLGFFDGTIIIDGTTAVTLPSDLSSLSGGGIVLRGTEMSFAAGSEKNISATGGASLTLTVTKEQEINGYETSYVTLDDSSALAFVGTDGTTLALLSSKDAKGGKYSLAPQEVVIYDSSIDQNFLKDPDEWTRTIWIKDNSSLTYFTSENYGNSNSVVRLTSCVGHLNGPTGTNKVTIELVDEDGKAALDLSNGWKTGTPSISKLTGTGTLATSGTTTSTSEKLFLHDISGFRGSLNLATKNVIVGTATPTSNTSNDGRLFVNANNTATVAAGKTWRVNGGAYVDGALVVLGTFAGNVTLSGGGTLIMGADGKVEGTVTGGVVAGYMQGETTVVITNFASSTTIPANAETIRFSFNGTDITGAFVTPEKGVTTLLTLDPSGSVDGVPVRPELSDGLSGDEPFSVSGDQATFNVKTIPGLWYSVKSGTEIVAGGIGGTTATTEPQQATGAVTELQSGKPAESAGFYKVFVTLSGN